MHRSACCVVVGLGIPLLGAVANPAAAQTTQDSAAIQLAVARYIKLAMTANTILESRTQLPRRGHAPPPNEQTTTALLAQELGLRTGHLEDAFYCATPCAIQGIQKVIAIDAPQIHGNRAVVTVEFIERMSDAPHVHIGSQEYIVEKRAAGWRVTRLGATSTS